MIVEQIIDKAAKRSQAAQASFSRSESNNVGFETSRLKEAGARQSTRLSLRVVVDGLVGVSSATDCDDIDTLVDQAIESAAFGSPAHAELPGPMEAQSVKTSDDRVRAVTRAEMVDAGQGMVDQLLEYNDEIVASGGLSTSHGEHEFANSAGASFREEGTSIGAYIGGQLTRGEDILMAGKGKHWRAKEIDHDALAEEVVERFRQAENVAEIRSGEIPVIFPPDAARVWLMALEMGVNGKNVFMGSSPLAGRLGETLTDERLTIIDNPLVDFAAASGGYDDEGVAHRVTPLIENGVLRAFLYDLDTAGRAGAQSTGHGIGCGTTNVIVSPGETPFAHMIRDTNEGLLIRSVLGLGQGNAISGEFSVNVHLGYKIENGEIVGRVKNVMLSGNSYDALKRVEQIGAETEWVSGALQAPAIKVGGLSVTAK